MFFSKKAIVRPSLVNRSSIVLLWFVRKDLPMSKSEITVLILAIVCILSIALFMIGGAVQA